jgi:hypothetical protein
VCAFDGGAVAISYDPLEVLARLCETQNWFQARLTPTASPEFRVHGTPGYGVGVTAGLTFRWE